MIDVNFVITMLLTLSDWSRSTVDLLVAIAHIVACPLLYGLTQYYDDYAGRLLLVMESVTVVFHLFYCVSISNSGGPYWLPYWFSPPEAENPNLWKWLEYRYTVPPPTPTECLRELISAWVSASRPRSVPLRLRTPTGILALHLRLSCYWPGTDPSGPR